MARPDLIALAERVEKAEGPDREADKAIYAALGNCNHERTKYYCIEDGNDTDSGHTCLDCGKDTYGAKTAPVYTASLDAAMTLVPEGHQFGCGSEDATLKAWAWAGIYGNGDQIANAATPALALTAAALRDRAAQADAQPNP